MRVIKFLSHIVLATQATARAIGNNLIVERGSGLTQNIVTYDEHSIKVYGKRLYVFSAEIHPFRLPVPDYWLDLFQKVKALGFNTVSFYVHWGLVEGEPGVYRAEGIFSFETFFDAAAKAGIYLIARPGPYINAEVTGGGLPGWLARSKGQLRTRDPEYLKATDNYIANIGKTIAKAQITNGGPVILVQPENEYSLGVPEGIVGGFPDPEYWLYIKNQLYNAGIVVPLINNDGWPQGLFAPGFKVNGSTAGNVDIYGYNNYPLGFNCAQPDNWPINQIPTSFAASHEKNSPTTPHSVLELQGGAYDPWGGPGFEKCSALLNHEFERVFYKNMFAAKTTVLNIYMAFGGTNWGGLSHGDGYTSYDYGAAISEDRGLNREKYSELKLEAQFQKVSPAFLTTSVGTAVNGTYADTSDIFTTPLWGNESASNFYVVRHADYQKTTSTSYKFTFKTSEGNIKVPQLGGSLTLTRRDSKWHVADYDVGGINLLYSTAEIFTWKKLEGKTVLIVYGGATEQHELAVKTSSSAKIIEGKDVITKSENGTTIFNWKVTNDRRVVQVGSLYIYLLDRNTAYNYWVPDFVRTDKWGAYSAGINNTNSVIVEAGYLIRSVYINGPALHLDGDFNATVPIKVIGAPSTVRSLHVSGTKLEITKDATTGDWSSSLTYSAPAVNIPDLSSLTWKYVDDLPELQPTYDDSLWTRADKTTSNNLIELQGPVSLYASDYGYHTGVLIFRGHFVANGNESDVKLWTMGGSAFGSSVWVNSTYLGSWTGDNAFRDNNSTYKFPRLTAGKNYVLTVLVDNHGLDGNWFVGGSTMKLPRGIVDYSISRHLKTAVTWKLTGNLKGEQYIDKERGPVNEGGLFAQRQGFHQPYPPNRSWASGHPEKGISKPGVAFYQSSFKLDLPRNYDIPIQFNFGNTTNSDGSKAEYRALLWVNGYQFGKYVNGIGPQKVFPVPQGILNYQGTNWIAVEIWAQQEGGAHLTDFKLTHSTPVWTSFKTPRMAPTPDYRKREAAY